MSCTSLTNEKIFLFKFRFELQFSVKCPPSNRESVHTMLSLFPVILTFAMSPFSNKNKMQCQRLEYSSLQLEHSVWGQLSTEMVYTK